MKWMAEYFLAAWALHEAWASADIFCFAASADTAKDTTRTVASVEISSFLMGSLLCPDPPQERHVNCFRSEYFPVSLFRNNLGAHVRVWPKADALLLFEVRPCDGLDSGDQLVTAVSVRLENGRLTLAHLEPVFAEGIQNVRLVRDHDDIRARGRHRRNDLAQGAGASIVLDRRHHEPAFGVIDRRLDRAELHQCARIDRPLEQAGVDLSNGDAQRL